MRGREGAAEGIPQVWSVLQAAQLLISCVEEGHEEFRTNLKRQPEPIKETSRELFLLLVYVGWEREGRGGEGTGGERRERVGGEGRDGRGREGESGRGGKGRGRDGRGREGESGRGGKGRGRDGRGREGESGRGGEGRGRGGDEEVCV